jgi:hypothetical protein
LKHAIVSVPEDVGITSLAVDAILDTPLGSPAYERTIGDLGGGESEVMRYSPLGLTSWLPLWVIGAVPYVEKSTFDRDDYRDNALIIESVLGLIGYHTHDRVFRNVDNLGVAGANHVRVRSSEIGLHLSRYTYQINEFMRFGVSRGIQEQPDKVAEGYSQLTPIVVPGLDYYYVAYKYQFKDPSNQILSTQDLKGFGFYYGIYGGVYYVRVSKWGSVLASLWGHYFRGSERVKTAGEDVGLFERKKNAGQKYGANLLIGYIF